MKNNYTIACYKQKQLFDCGCACIAGLLNQLKIEYNYHEILVNSKKTTFGSNYLGLKICLDVFGVNSNVYECSIKDLCRNQSTKIIKLKLFFLKHFVPFLGETTKSYVIMEPSIGRIMKIQKKIFELVWTGEALFIDN